MLGEIQAEDMGMKGRSERICGQDGSRERAVGEGGPGQWGGGQVRVDLHIPGFVGLFKSPLIFFFHVHLLLFIPFCIPVPCLPQRLPYTVFRVPMFCTDVGTGVQELSHTNFTSST